MTGHDTTPLHYTNTLTRVVVNMLTESLIVNIGAEGENV